MASNKFNKNQKTLLSIVLIIIIFFITFFIFNNILNKDAEDNETEMFDCSDESRNVDSCANIYSPVCGLVHIQCIQAPCNPVLETFPNSCVACSNSLVEYYTKGECPG